MSRALSRILAIAACFWVTVIHFTGNASGETAEPSTISAIERIETESISAIHVYRATFFRQYGIYHIPDGEDLNRAIRLVPRGFGVQDHNPGGLIAFPAAGILDRPESALSFESGDTEICDLKIGASTQPMMPYFPKFIAALPVGSQDPGPSGVLKKSLRGAQKATKQSPTYFHSAKIDCFASLARTSNWLFQYAPFQGEVENGGEQGKNPVAPILFALIIIILAAKLGGDLVERFKQPAVLGELLFGVILGNLTLIGINALEPLRHHITIEILAEIGVILLLFEVGLESSLKEMMSVGMTSFFVALIGVISPFFLGWWVSAMFFPDETIFIHIFIGATLTATSVGITARVLKDLGKVRTREAKIILGAAVFDDIMGLVVLAVVVGIITAHNTGGNLSSLSVLWVIGKAFLFIIGALTVGNLIAPHFFKLASKLRAQSVLITFSLMFCFFFALVADKIGLAPIVGAFAAGIILSGIDFRDLFRHEERNLQELISPITAFLVPIFFVYMGMNVDLSTLGNFNVIVFATALTLAAIIGKQACSLAGIFERKINAWAVGIGMIPRGEVGLIFVGIGANLKIDGVRVVNPDAYSAVIIMVMITTLVTPPILKLVFVDKGR